MPTEFNRKMPVDITCQNCHARNPRPAHLCRGCRTMLALFETLKRSRPAGRAVMRPLIRKLSNARNFARPFAENIKPRLERAKTSSEEILADEWRALADRLRSVVESLREIIPDLPLAVEWLAQVE